MTDEQKKKLLELIQDYVDCQFWDGYEYGRGNRVGKSNMEPFIEIQNFLKELS